MKQSLIKKGMRQARKLLIIQWAIGFFVAAIGVTIEIKVAVALLSGEAAVLIANSCFVYKAFSFSGAQQSKKVVGAFYFGETVKILMSVGLLAAGFHFLPQYEIYTLVGYILALLSQWLTPVIVKTH